MTQPTTEAQTQVTEIDGSDEQDHNAMEVAFGAALAALLLAELLPGPASFIKGVRGWNARVDAALGPVLRGFLQRSAGDIAADSDVPGASLTALQEAEKAYPQILRWIQDRSWETLQNMTDANLPQNAKLAERVTAAAENLARGAAVYAKSEVRERTVGALGAIWKIWRTRHDDRVRYLHQELEGARVPFDGTFVVDGIHIRYPGDPEAPIEMTAGCRCHLNYRLKPKEADFAEV